MLIQLPETFFFPLFLLHQFIKTIGNKINHISADIILYIVTAPLFLQKPRFPEYLKMFWICRLRHFDLSCQSLRGKKQKRAAAWLFFSCARPSFCVLLPLIIPYVYIFSRVFLSKNATKPGCGFCVLCKLYKVFAFSIETAIQASSFGPKTAFLPLSSGKPVFFVLYL